MKETTKPARRPFPIGTAAALICVCLLFGGLAAASYAMNGLDGGTIYYLIVGAVLCVAIVAIRTVIGRHLSTTHIHTTATTPPPAATTPRAPGMNEEV